MSVSTDEELVASIAKSRDRAAFEELYQRYSELAFNVAFHVTGDRTLAEETAQEALLSVWLSAQNFEPGSARAWILQIVARKGIRAIQGQQSEKKRMHAKSDQRNDSTLADALERNELLAALRGRLAELPELERQLVALHFGAGLSQREIGAALEIPQQTISVRINKAIENLRGSLTRAGFAAALPLIGAEGLSAAISSGQAVPPGLREKVLAGMAKSAAGHTVRALSQRLVAAKTTSTSVTAVVLFATVAGTGIFWVVNGARLKPLPAPPRAAPAAAPSVAPAVVSVPIVEDFKDIAHWSFAKGPAKDLQAVTENWEWLPNDDDTSGSMISSDGQPVIVLLPIRFKKDRPFAITLKLVAKGAHMQSFAMWVKDKTVQPNSSLDVGGKTKHPEITQRLLFTDRYTKIYFDGAPTCLTTYESAYPGDRVVLQFDKFAVEEISVKALSKEEVNDEFPGPEMLSAEFESGPHKVLNHIAQELPIP